MAQKIEDPKQERPLQSFPLKNFLAVNTTNARTALQDQALYNLENAQPIGLANIHSINDIGALLHNYAGDTIYYDSSLNIGGTDYLIQASTNGKLFAYNVNLNTVSQINGANVLSGSTTWVTQWNSTTALIIDGSGYFTWTGSGNITSIGGVTGAPSSGNTIAVYQNRVWITQGRVLFFSASGSFSDFTVADGGGSVTLNDPTLRSNVRAMYAFNGYLYYWGTSSVNAISDLYVPAGASPPTPGFTNLNLSAIIGTDQPSSIMAYGRLILFANRWGVWSLYGTQVQSISSQDPNNQYQSSIDGTWQYVNFQQPVSGGQVISNNLLCACFLIQRNSDPIFGSNTVLMIYQGDAAGGKWWSANYGAVTRISTAFVNDAPAIFAYIGNQLFQLFANTASSPAANIKTALWDFGDPITQKQAIRGGVGMSILGGAGSPTLSLDTPSSSTPFATSLIGAVQWVNQFGVPVTWVNSLNQPVTWTPGLFTTFWGDAPQGFSKYLGYTLTVPQGTSFELNSFLMDYKWGARWVGR